MSMNNRYITIKVDDVTKTITYNLAEAIASAVENICTCVVWSVEEGEISFCTYGDWDQYTAVRKKIRRLGRGKVRFRLLTPIVDWVSDDDIRA